MPRFTWPQAYNEASKTNESAEQLIETIGISNENSVENSAERKAPKSSTKHPQIAQQLLLR